MSPTAFPECNVRYGPPEDMAESQVMTLPAYRGQVVGGSVDGCVNVVVAWLPSITDLEKLLAGEPVYISMLGERKS